MARSWAPSMSIIQNASKPVCDRTGSKPVLLQSTQDMHAAN